MLSLKSTGGLTRRTGFEEIQHSIYILSRPASAEVSTSIQELIDTNDISSDQHKSSSNSRAERDNIDIDKLIYSLKEYNPFSNEKNLRNIVTGIVANGNVNVKQAGEIGKNVLKLMEDQTVVEFSFKSS